MVLKFQGYKKCVNSTRDKMCFEMGNCYHQQFQFSVENIDNFNDFDETIDISNDFEETIENFNGFEETIENF